MGTDVKIGTGQLTSDNLIDEDFEAELASCPSVNPNLTEFVSEKDSKTMELRNQIDRYGIVNVCASDSNGRPIIVVSACNLPENEAILKEGVFKSQLHFFDCLLE